MGGPGAPDPDRPEPLVQLFPLPRSHMRTPHAAFDIEIVFLQYVVFPV